jgi:pimeloyl-ACP methyl ester carboxylesterase
VGNIDANIIYITQLIFISIVLRIAVTAADKIGHWTFIILSYWCLNPFSIWLFVSALGGYTPIWPALIIGIIESLIYFVKKDEKLIYLADILQILLLGYISIPMINIYVLFIGVIIWMSLIIFLNIAMQKIPLKGQISCCLAPVIIVGVLGIGWRHILKNQVKIFKEYFPNIGITFPHNGDRIVLDTGAVGWFDKSKEKGPYDAALFFHGANPEGARQPAAIILRRALSDAGIAVLSVDYIGFGETPVPPKNVHISKWDPLPHALSGLKTLYSKKEVDKVFVMGHSMGSGSVVWLLGQNQKIKGAVIFGGGIDSKKGEKIEPISDYWYKRFHSDRKMKYMLSKKEIMAIDEKYSTEIGLTTLTKDHASILFVYFENEWPDLIKARQNLYEAIPGKKKIWNLNGSTHYFSSIKYGNFIIGDTRVAKRVANRMKLLKTDSI